MDDTKLSKREEEYLDALIEGLENLVSKLSTTELSYICNDKVFCKNYQVACGSYNCNYADVVNNTLICTAKSCNYQSIYTPIKLKLHSGSVYGKTVYDLISGMSDEDYPF